MRNLLRFCSVLMVIVSCSNRTDTFKTVEDFKEKVIEDYQVVNSPKKELSVQECIELTKVYNTISYYSLKDSVFQDYSEKYSDNYLLAMSEKLECKAGIGMGLYSKKYKINIGGAVRFAPGSYFPIDALKR